MITLTDKRGHPVPSPPSPRLATGQGISLAQQSPVRVSVQPLHRREIAQLTGQAWRNVVYQVASYEANVPYVDGAIGRAADYRGAVTPYPGTEDLDWNREIRPWLDETFYDNRGFDASGKLTPDDFQAQMWRYHDRDGDCLTIPVKDPEQRGRPCWRLFPALAIDSPGACNPSTGWVDGVKVGLHHRALAYHILFEEAAVGWNVPLNRAGYLVDAADAFHFANWRAVGRSRGTTVFLSSGATVVDLAMLDSSLHRIFNLASKLGIAFETEAGAGKGSLKTVEGAFEDDTVESPSAVDTEGNPIDLARFKEIFMGDGPAVIETEPGQKARIFEGERDLPDVSAVRAADLERIALAYRLPVQVLLCIYSGVFNLTGPGFRVALTSAVRWREKQLKRIEPFVRRTYAAHIAWGLTTRQIPFPKRSLRPYTCKTRWEKVIGIDEGRDVNLDKVRLQLGATDEAEIAHEYGRDIYDVITTRAAVIHAVCREFGWTPTPEMWGKDWSAAPPPTAAPAGG